VFLHDHTEHQRRVALMADTVAGRVFITSVDGRHIGNAQQSAVDFQGHVFNQRQAVEGTVDTDIGAGTGGFHKARRRHSVLRSEGGEDLVGLDAQGREALIGKLDENPLGLLAEDIDLLHPRQIEETLAQLFSHLHLLAMGQVFGLQGVQRKVHIGIFIVEKRSDHSLGQPRRFIAELFAGLVEQVLNLAGAGGFEERHAHRHKTWLGDGLDAVVVIQLLQAFFQAVGDLLLHFLGSGAGPGGRDGHHLDGEGWVFGSPQFAERENAGGKDRNDQEQRDRTVLDR